MSKVVQLPGAAKSPVKQPSKRDKKVSNLDPHTGLRRVRYTTGHDPETKKPIVKNFYGESIKAAEAARDAWIKAEAERERLAALDIDPDQTVAHWVDSWRETYGTRGEYSSATSEKCYCEKIKVFFKGKSMSSVREMDIQQFANTAKKRSKSYVTKLRQITQNVFARAASNDIITKNPCDGVRWAWGHEGTHRNLEPWEIVLINDHWAVHKTILWALIMLFSGLRRGELLALTWEDIDFDGDKIHVTKAMSFEGEAPVLGPPKSKASVRDIPLVPPLKDVLLQVRGEGLICRDTDDKAVRLGSWVRAWETYNNTMANILNGDTSTPVAPGRRSDKDKKLRPNRKAFSVQAHDLRHTFATMLHDADVDLLSAQKWLGHAEARAVMGVTAIYQHLSPEKEKASIEKIFKYTKKWLKKAPDGV